MSPQQNDDGYFVFRYLLVDIPSTSGFQSCLQVEAQYTTIDSRTRQRTRVFVERAPGVSEHEHVMF
jgi:hypothetical protein